MKTRAEIVEAVATLANEYMLWRTAENRMKLEKALDAWRSAPPDPPELKITPGPLILSPADRLSDEKIWHDHCVAGTNSASTFDVVQHADFCLAAFRKRFREEPK
jgi:hypothetical protein